MKKSDEMRAEYRREDIGKGVRGKHFNAYQKGSNFGAAFTGVVEDISDQ